MREPGMQNATRGLQTHFFPNSMLRCPPSRKHPSGGHAFTENTGGSRCTSSPSTSSTLSARALLRLWRWHITVVDPDIGATGSLEPSNQSLHWSPGASVTGLAGQAPRQPRGAGELRR